MPRLGKIDCHAHFIPPDYRTALHEHGHSHPDGMPGVPPWSEEDHLDMMKAVNTTRSIISISSPGVHLVAGNHELSKKLARYCNEYAADLKRRRPDQFGFWAILPLPDIQGSLAEIKYAFDHLNADGVKLSTNYHGIYLGDTALDPIFDELNRRKATIFIHPTAPCMPSGQSASPLRFPYPMYEFLFDTARICINLFLSGTISRCPNITFVIPHAGGTFPPLIRRFSTIAPLQKVKGTDPNVNFDWVKERLNKQFFFDTAGYALQEQLQGLLRYVSIDRIIYGSDYCFAPLAAAIEHAKTHDQELPAVFPEEKDQEAVSSGNARRLLQKDSLKL